jgi:hypothetical protein
MPVVVDVRFPSMLAFHVFVGEVDVLDGGVVVRVCMGGQQMRPVLPFMHVVRDVEVLVVVIKHLVCVMLRDGHGRYLPSRLTEPS